MKFKIPNLTKHIILMIIFLYVSLLATGLIFIETIDGQLLDLLFSIFSYSSVIYIFQKSVKNSSFEIQYILGDINFKRAPWKKLIFITLVLLLFGSTFVMAIMYVIQVINSSYFYEMLLTSPVADSIPFMYKFLIFLVTVTLAPIAEELYFRGYLLNKLGSGKSLIRAVLLSSLLFSLLHIDGFFLPQFLGGIFYSLVYIKTRKLILPIILHALHNFIAGVPFLLPENEGVVSELPPLYVLENILLIGTILFLILFSIVCWFCLKNLKKLKGNTPYDLNKTVFYQSKGTQ